MSALSIHEKLRLELLTAAIRKIGIDQHPHQLHCCPLTTTKCFVTFNEIISAEFFSSTIVLSAILVLKLSEFI